MAWDGLLVRRFGRREVRSEEVVMGTEMGLLEERWTALSAEEPRAVGTSQAMMFELYILKEGIREK